MKSVVIYWALAPLGWMLVISSSFVEVRVIGGFVIAVTAIVLWEKA